MNIEKFEAEIPEITPLAEPTVKKIEKEEMTVDDYNQTEKFLRTIYEKENRPEEAKTNIEHTKQVVNFAEKIAESERKKNPTLDIDVVKTAAWLHDCGKMEAGQEDFIKHHFIGAEKAKEFLKTLNKNEEFIEKVADCISSHMGPPKFMEVCQKEYQEKKDEFVELPTPKTPEAQIVYDADMLSLISLKGLEKIVKIRQEFAKEKFKDPRVIDSIASAWLSANEAYASLYTETGKKLGKPLIAQIDSFVTSLSFIYEGFEPKDVYQRAEEFRKKGYYLVPEEKH